MNAKIRRNLAARKRQIQKRLDKTKFGQECPVISAANIHYEITDRTRAVSVGGIGMIHQMAKKLDLDQMINQRLNMLKIYMPYSESDHVLNMSYNMLAGGTCLEHLELLRNNEVLHVLIHPQGLATNAVSFSLPATANERDAAYRLPGHF